MEQSGGAIGIRDFGALESALAQPRATFDQVELYPTLIDKVAALCHALIANHPFVDGNKRIEHAAMEPCYSLMDTRLSPRFPNRSVLFWRLQEAMLAVPILQNGWSGMYDNGNACLLEVACRGRFGHLCHNVVWKEGNFS